MGGKQSRSIERNIRAEFEHQLSSIRNDVATTKASLGASRNDVETLKQQLSTCQKTLQEMDMQLHAATVKSGKQLSSTKSELEKLKGQISTRENIQKELGRKLHRMTELDNRVHSSMVEVLSRKNSLEVSNMDVNALREKTMTYDKLHQDMEMKLDKIIGLETQLSSINVKVVETKSSFRSYKENEDGLVKEAMSHDNLVRDTKVKLHYIFEFEKELNWALSQEILAKDCLEDLKKEEYVLKEQLCDCEKFHKEMEMKLLKIMQLEKNISSTTSEVLFANEMIKLLQMEEKALKEQMFNEEKFEANMGIEIKKCLYNCNFEGLK